VKRTRASTARTPRNATQKTVPRAAALTGQEPQQIVGAHALFHPECWTRAAPEVWQLVAQKARAEDVVEE